MQTESKVPRPMYSKPQHSQPKIALFLTQIFFSDSNTYEEQVENTFKINHPQAKTLAFTFMFNGKF